MRFPEICPGPGDRTFHHLPEAYGPQAVGNAPLKSTRQPCSAFLPNISNRFARGILLGLLPSKILTRSFRMLQVPKLFVGTCCSSLAHQDTSKIASMMDGWMFVPIPDTEKTRTAPLLWFKIWIIHWWFNYFPWPGTNKFWVVEEAMTSQSSTTFVTSPCVASHFCQPSFRIPTCSAISTEEITLKDLSSYHRDS